MLFGEIVVLLLNLTMSLKYRTLEQTPAVPNCCIPVPPTLIPPEELDVTIHVGWGGQGRAGVVCGPGTRPLRP